MKRKLLFAATLLAGAFGFNANAQNDVTEKYIKNAKLTEGTVISVGVTTYDYDTEKNGTQYYNLVDVQDWSAVDNTNGKAGGIFSLTDPAFLGGTDYKSPGSDADGNTEGNILGLVTCWKASAQYTQAATVEAGTYTLVLSVYNSAGTTAAVKNLIGFITDDGKEYLATTTSYAVGKWTYEFITITLEENTSGKWSLGYTSDNAGSGSCPHLFFSPLTLFDGKVDEAAYAAKKELDRTINLANATLANEAYQSYAEREKTILQNAINAAQNASSENYAEAAAALQAAIDAFIASPAYVDLLNKEIEKAKALGMDISEYESNMTTASSVLVKEIKVAEYKYVTETYKYGVELGTWTGTGTNSKPAVFNNEHWSGTVREYMNQDDSNGQGWNANSWTLNFTQDVVIPAGNYVFKVAARQASDAEHMKTSLVVKKGEEVLGTVDDFPTNGSNARGINKDGETSFDEDADKYANNGNGFGWEWRYVKFSLDEEATVNLAVNAEATAIHMWVSFGDYTLQTDNEATAALLEYNKVLQEAKTVIENADYAIVDGDDKDALQAAIDGDATLNKTSKEDVEAATANLNDCIATFIAAKALYETYNTTAAAVKNLEVLPYASEDKLNAYNEAINGKVTSGKDAAEKTSIIRKYVESNALAEGVDGATIIEITDSNIETAYDADTKTFGAWTVIGQTNGTIQWLDNQSFTDGDGNNNYHYADIYKNDNNAGIQQTVNLEPGKYILTVTARANTTSGAAFRVFAGSATNDISRIGNTGGVFGNGWNDVTVEFEITAQQDVNIGVQAGNGKDIWWSATRFRLVRLGDVTVTAEITEAEFATYVAPVNVKFGGDVTAYIVTDVNNGYATLEKVTSAKAGTPVILNAEEGEYEFTVVAEADDHDADNELHVAPEGGISTTGIYVLANIEGEGVGFYALGEGVTLPAGKVYLNAPATESKFIGFNFGGETTGINGVETAPATENAVIYNLAGQRVVNPAKGGIYIVNGKKVLVK